MTEAMCSPQKMTLSLFMEEEKFIPLRTTGIKKKELFPAYHIRFYTEGNGIV